MAIIKPNEIDMVLAYVVLEILRRKGYTAGIVGGYARDTFFGVTPKDCDICIAIPKIGEDDYHVTTCGISNMLICELKKMGFDPGVVKVSGMYNQKASDRVFGVVQFPDKNVDVILYRDCATMPDIIEAFDFNLNQFGMDGPDDDIPIYCGETDLRHLEVVRGDASPERSLKVMRKHEALLDRIKQAYREGDLV